MSVAGTDVFFVERTPSTPTAPTVLFLHGASFNAEVWIRTGILDNVAAAGSRAVAVDLPGFGLTPSTDSNRGEFLGLLIDQLDEANNVVVVSPSMSGSFSLPMIATRGTDSMLGFIPIAPIGISDFASAAPTPIDGLPTLAIWGSNDNVVDVALADDLLNTLPDGELLVIDDAGHAAYQDQPATFTNAVTAFLSTLPQPES